MLRSKMPDIESVLKRWLSAGVLDPAAAARIRAYEAQQNQPKGLRWQVRVALILGGILLASGIVLFVSAHWDELGPGWRYAVVLFMVAAFHIGGAIARERFRALSTTLHAVGTIATGAAIALVGQIFNIQEHWPAAILLWFMAALAGRILLRDEAQQTLALLLFPAWLTSEWFYAADNHIGVNVFIGRFLITWSALYLTVFLGSPRKITRGVVFAAAAIASVVGIVIVLEGWRSWSGTQTFLPFHTRFWGWMAIAVLPLLLSLLRLRQSFIPVLAGIAFALALPWCTHSWIPRYPMGPTYGSYTRTDPNLAAYALVAAYCVFLIWWGVRKVSQSLVNVAVVGFGATVAWFYFSDLLDKMDRSLGLIGLGILFLAGGWVLEKTRRSLITHMAQSAALTQEAQ
jgi:uncharacterized membrane protein